ncbi:MAG TPA: citrate transporter [Candidatus Eremiobacteraeota bacterium]|nr:citrate transporter [Candidatus Eremiobacteraeota bacterium]
MYTNKISALIALPLMAFIISLIAMIPYGDIIDIIFNGGVVPVKMITDPIKNILKLVLEEGTWRLSATIMTVLFGSMLGQLIDKTGIAKSLIKKTAELAGDRPFIIAMSLTLVISILFTVLGGLGAIIMVATIVFPIMLSIGISPMVAGCIFLLALSLGGVFNFVNWQMYIDVLKLQKEDIINFAVPFGLLFFLVILSFILIEFKKEGIKLHILGKRGKKAPPSAFKRDIDVEALVREKRKKKGINIQDTLIDINKEFEVSWYALLTPVIPIILVFSSAIYSRICPPPETVPPTPPFIFPIIPALMAGMVYGLITTRHRGRNNIQVLTKSIFEGIESVAPAVALMIGIGMLLNAVMDDSVKTIMAPLIGAVMPRSGIMYVIFFTLCAPLALYRGPLNLWGLGSGLMALMVATGSIPGAAVMGALFSVGMIQGVCDPTNTHNVWIANYLGLDIQKILRKTIVYMWVLALLGLLFAGIKYF